jgi:hypothetical protein
MVGNFAKTEQEHIGFSGPTIDCLEAIAVRLHRLLAKQSPLAIELLRYLHPAQSFVLRSRRRSPPGKSARHVGKSSGWNCYRLDCPDPCDGIMPPFAEAIHAEVAKEMAKPRVAMSAREQNNKRSR